MTNSDRWAAQRDRLRELIARRRGVIIASAKNPLPEATWDGILVRRYDGSGQATSVAEAAVLPWLTDQVLQDDADQLLRFAGEAIREGLPVFGATPVEYDQMASLARSSENPWALDVDRLLAREELAALLATVCEWRDSQRRASPGALYLTPIEARLEAGVGCGPRIGTAAGSYRRLRG